MNNRLSTASRIITWICALSLIGVLFLPIWRIELSAPQYPEGLQLEIYANRLGGNIDVVNGLNHYIGMRTLHEKDFFEFTLLPYIIGAFVVFGIAAAIVNRKWFFLIWVGCYLLFALVAMIDFYHWEYNYGHNLDPSAPIQVPGMTYQPPLIGYKQLLNFGAWSVPGAGGWIFIGTGVLMALFGFLELRRKANKSFTNVRTGLTTAAVIIVICCTSCSTGPQPIKFGKDACDFCKMTILDQRFGGEVITPKGKVYKFDDIHCISSFLKSDPSLKTNVAGIYLLDYSTQNKFVPANESFLLQSNDLHSPMGGNTAAFNNEANREQAKQQVSGTNVQWNDIIQ
ncbi:MULTISPECIES: nitrous oxide reductase accessory protein NosL [Niastella]|uniref:Nitrous oxide reductase accessory protein NosL n=1 Tax=Niastella soli TaxID=2821487 RepID=A0ABS3YLJ3_9BACT|nr:nitrous oxide reductase accessory protein NosL [Niastella soli]MBO9198768.1 nitrous oxide reductase accessory protein NosL [Niastella soli]